MSWFRRKSTCSTEGDSPSSIRHQLNFDEFCETPAKSVAYCNRQSEDDFQQVTLAETEKAIEDLVRHLESNPSAYLRILRKRKIEEMENSGIFSFIKVKMMTAIKGSSYGDGLVTEDECQTKLSDLANSMMLVHNYTKEANTKRFSQRLAEKARAGQTDSKRARPLVQTSSKPDSLCRPSIRTKPTANVPLPPPPPPPLPPALPPPPPLPPALPPPSVFPLKERNASEKSRNLDQKKLTKVEIKQNLPRSESTTSLTDIHTELMKTNPMKRLRSTQVERSPGGTPAQNPSKLSPTRNGDVFSPQDCPDSLGRALKRAVTAKFHNIRSPSSSICSSPGAFDP